MGNYNGTEVAIIGMSGRFPGANSINELWNLLSEGKEGIRFFSNDELKEAGLTPETYEHDYYVKARGILDGIEDFDADFFGYRPSEAEMMDPQQRFFLKCAWESLEDSGYAPDSFDGQIGVFAGVDGNSYLMNNLMMNKKYWDSNQTMQSQLSNDKDFLSLRVSYKLNLKGPSLTVQTACSTSLVAVHLACQSLLNRECDLALSGGASIIVPQVSGQIYQEGGILSPDGHCRAFDRDAQGTVRGNGVACIVLKRLSEAIEDQDHIYAVIKGSAINNDGGDKAGFTAPSAKGQRNVIIEAQVLAGVEPESISYVEAHGTGTRVGDPIEIQGLTAAFDSELRQFCAVGSIKSNLGHLGAASGVAGLIKTALALKYKKIPPSIHYKEANPQINFSDTPFFVNEKLVDWEKPEGQWRRAGVSSFGLGGTNAHIVLEEAPASNLPSTVMKPALFVLSAKTPTALEVSKLNLVQAIKDNPSINLQDVAYTLQTGRSKLDYRTTAVFENVEEAIQQLPGSKHFAANSRNRKIVFVYTGQGSQFVNMGRELYSNNEMFRKEMDQCFTIADGLLESSLKDILFPNNTNDAMEAAAKQLEKTEIAQPALFILEYALTQMWMKLGVVPSALIGHSLGELVAACVAGVFSLEQGLSVTVARGRIMGRTEQGAMIAVSLTEEETRRLLGPDTEIAAVNGPAQCIVSGSPDAIGKLEDILSASGIISIRLNNSHAFHSFMMDKVVTPFNDIVSNYTPHAPKIPLISNVTGTWITESEATSSSYWASHIRRTVRFWDGIQTLMEKEDVLFLEVGPGQQLSSLIKRNQLEACTYCSMENKKQDSKGYNYILNTIGEMWCSGGSINWKTFHSREKVSKLSLPTYPFEERRYWLSPNLKLNQFLKNDISCNETDLLSAQEKTDESILPDKSLAPADEETVESFIYRIWGELIGTPDIGPDSNFFELGGDSLLGIQMLSMISKKYSVILPVSKLMSSPTAKQFGIAVKELLHSEFRNELNIHPVTANRFGEWFPVSFAQEKMWYTFNHEPYRHYQSNDAIGYRIKGKLNIEALEASINEIVDRHRSFRTNYRLIEGEVMQSVRENHLICLRPMQDLRGLAEKAFAWSTWEDGWWSSLRRITRQKMFRKLRNLSQSDFEKPFDLEKDQLFQAKLYHLGHEDYALFIYLHRITADGWSEHMFINELAVLYNNYAGGKRIELPGLKVHYTDFSVWQREYFSKEIVQERLNYWRDRLDKHSFDMRLPVEKARTEHARYETAHHFFELDQKMTNDIHTMSERLGITPFILLLSAFKWTLGTFIDQNDLTIGIPVHNRDIVDIQNIVGRIGYVVCLRTDLNTAEGDFLKYVSVVNQSFNEAQNHGLPFEMIHKEFWPETYTRFMPMYRVMFTYYNIPLAEDNDIEDLDMSILEVQKNRLDSDLGFVVIPEENTFSLDFRYDPELFSITTIEQMESQFMSLIEVFPDILKEKEEFYSRHEVLQGEAANER